VLKLIAEGLGTKAIEFRLGVSVKTVETQKPASVLAFKPIPLKLTGLY